MAAGRGKEGAGGPAPAGLPILTAQTRLPNRPRVSRQRAAPRPAPASPGWRGGRGGGWGAAAGRASGPLPYLAWPV